MVGQIPVNPSIGEPRPKGNAQPDFLLQSSANPAEVSNTLGSSSGMLSDIARKRLLPALVGAPAPRHAARSVPVGILIYLLAVGIVAAATVGVFFGAGFFLLAQPTAAMIANNATAEQISSVKRRVPQIMAKTSPTSSDVASVPIQPEIPPSAATAVLPVVSLAPLAGRPSPIDNVSTSPAPDRSVGEVSLGSPAPEPAPAAFAPAAPAAEPAPGSSAGAPTAAAAPSLSAGQITELLTRGDIFLHAGDVASARLFYERAADAGDREAAMRMGATFDPAFLVRVGLNARGDPATALSWYRHALDLGAPKTDRQTQSPLTK
jgi:hypothetical protein